MFFSSGMKFENILSGFQYFFYTTYHLAAAFTLPSNK